MTAPTEPAPVQQTSLKEVIRTISIFADLSEAELSHLCRSSRRVAVKAGQRIIHEGAPGDALFAILTGELVVTKREGDREQVLASRKAGDILGEMSLFEQGPRTASVSAAQDSELLEIDYEGFRQVLDGNPGIAATMLRTFARRLRSTEASLMQREKLASLGTLAAGLAHELNNPAAAIQRSGQYLTEALASSGRWAAELDRIELSDTERRLLAELQQRIEDAELLSPADVSSEMERRIVKCLEALGIGEAWDIAPALAAGNWTADMAKSLAEMFSPEARGAVLGMAAAQLSSRQLVGEIRRSAEAISDIVRAVKSYAYLDQAAVQNVDLAKSFEDTLMILKHKLKHGVTVLRDLDPDLPRIEAYAGELNQVWTNLIDNAVDAMEGKGTLELHAHRVGDSVEVVVADSGPGIPADIASRIFDPFFTTKPQGVGTGLGLHIARNIVVNRHRGSIDLETRSGRTEFHIVLPLKLAHRVAEEAVSGSGPGSSDGQSAPG